MADKKISELTAVTAALLTHQFPAQEGSVNVRVSGAQLAALAGAVIGQTGFVEKTSDQAGITSTTPIDVTGLTIVAAIGKRYRGRFVLVVDATATSEGIRIGLQGPTSPTKMVYSVQHWTSLTAMSIDHFTGPDQDPADTGSAGTAVRFTIIDWILLNGANAGVVVPRVRAELGTLQSVAVRAGSWGTWLETG